MARIRTIKPEFFTDAKVTSMTPLARLFYVSLWCEADREGRLAWEPDTLKYRYLPADKCDVEKLANELTQRKLIRLYQADDKILCWIPAFAKNQVINNREVQSTLPAYSDDACVTRESGGFDAACGKEGRKGREGKEGTTPIVPKGDEHESFSDFWKAYPSRGTAANPRKPAAKAHLAAIKRGADPAELIRTAPTAAPSDKYGTEFVPQATTWLNEDRWKDIPKAPEVPRVQTEDEVWNARYEAWKRSPKPVTERYWFTDQWGPAPHLPGTKVPKHLLVDELAIPDFLRREKVA